MKTNNEFKVCSYSNTIRLMPQNYWIATIKENEVVFDSWDGMTRQLFKEGVITEPEVREFYAKTKAASNPIYTSQRCTKD